MMTKSIRAAIELSCPEMDPRPVQVTAHLNVIFALRSLSEWVAEMASAIEDRPRDDVLLDTMNTAAHDLLERAGAALATYRIVRDCEGGQS